MQLICQKLGQDIAKVSYELVECNPPKDKGFRDKEYKAIICPEKVWIKK